MGGAILSGLLSPDVTVEGGIRSPTAPRPRRRRCAATGVESLALETDPDANARALGGARIVLLGVKPAMVPDLLREIADARTRRPRRQRRGGRDDRDDGGAGAERGAARHAEHPVDRGPG